MPFVLSRRPASIFAILLSASLIPFSLLGLPTAEVLLLIGVGLFLFVIPMLEPASQKRKPLIHMRIAFVLFVFGFLLTRIAFMIFSKEPFSNSGDIQIWISLLFVIVSSYLFARNLVGWRQVVFGLCLSTTLMAIWCMVNSIVQGDLISGRLGFAGSINPNVLASFLDLTCAIALYKSMQGSILERRVFRFMGVVQLLAIVLTQSRGSIFGLIVLCCCLLWRIRSNKAILAGLLILAPLILGIGANKIFGRITNPSFNDMASNYGRVKLLESTWVVLNQNHFIFGCGMDNFKKEKMTTGFPAWFDQGAMMSSHNAHLEFLLGWGVFGFLGWILLLGGAMAAALNYSKRYSDPTGIGIMIGLISFGLHGLVESMVASPPFFVVVCTIIGVAYGISDSAVPFGSDRGKSVTE
ncbi:MAG: O-Antigen ligase [Fibrobacterota bacterium]|jgi:hypothetical protein